ncbi:HIT family protein [Nonomuraea sp. SBT364]|uniref:HIT family protein n=1 Tax=Nonomuraea sp. SBT364 TaxID=1580530 RepID=UPI00066ADD9D|nr:hypothetical protein [Nonomuraea sp. SBT364]
MEFCIFCELIAGRAEAGHVLVIPRAHVAGLADADDEVGTAIRRTARRLSVALRASGLRETAWWSPQTGRSARATSSTRTRH